jgi:hypothetical protein
VAPPRLVGDVPDLSSSLTEGNRIQASTAWLDWWKRVIEVEGAIELGEFTRGASQGNAVRKLATAHRAVFDPPDFESLAGWPSLQSISRMTCAQALRWHSKGHTSSPQEKERWRVMKAVADDLCAEYQVSASRLNAGVISLAVEGTWSSFPRPGVLLCSEEILKEGAFFAPLLRDAFTQGLALTG